MDRGRQQNTFLSTLKKKKSISIEFYIILRIFVKAVPWFWAACHWHHIFSSVNLISWKRQQIQEITMSHQVFNIPQTTDTSQGDIYTKHGTSHSHYNHIISHLSQQEVVEVVADVLSQANKAAKQLTTVQITLLNILKDTWGYFQPILWQSKEVFCAKSWFNQRVFLCRNLRRA